MGDRATQKNKAGSLEKPRQKSYFNRASTYNGTGPFETPLAHRKRSESIALLCRGERRDNPASVERGDLLGRLRRSGLDGLGDQGLAQFGQIGKL